jgi:ammonium transporter, Amt family
MKCFLSKTLAVLLMGGAVLLQTANEAFAAGDVIDSGDTAWMLTSTALVLLMTLPGLAAFYGGMVRKQNILATFMQSFATASLVAVLWVVFGYSLAFSNGNAFIGDLSRMLLIGMDFTKPFVLGQGLETAVATTIPEPVFMMFQMTFAIITPALIAGAFVDRMKFSAMLIFMALWCVFVYAPVAHWVWHPNGFLFAKGVLDFAGGTVVHINAGVAGLVAALVIGRRLGYMQDSFVPHNPVYSVIGASLLWVGWFGFNAGSALAANGRAALAMTVTMVAAAMAAISWMMVEWIIKGKPSVLGTITGAIAGLVAVTPASGYIDVAGGLCIGAISGGFCYLAATTMKQALRYDDSLDCFGVHGVGGIIGALLTGVFATSVVGGEAVKGWIDGNPAQMLLQIEGILWCVAWCAIATWAILMMIKVTIGLRVPEHVEREGLDVALHGERVH